MAERKFSKAYDHDANQLYLNRELRRERQFNGIRGCNPAYPAPPERDAPVIPITAKAQQTFTVWPVEFMLSAGNHGGTGRG